MGGSHADPNTFITFFFFFFFLRYISREQYNRLRTKFPDILLLLIGYTVALIRTRP